MMVEVDLRDLEERLDSLEDGLDRLHMDLHALSIQTHNRPRRIMRVLCSVIGHDRTPAGLCHRCHDFERSGGYETKS